MFAELSEFPQMNTQGVFVVEFIGNGKSSRAVIRKGKLYVTDKIGPAGHELIVRNEMSQKRAGASVWLAGQEFTPDEDGVIIVPFNLVLPRHSDHHSERQRFLLPHFV